MKSLIQKIKDGEIVLSSENSQKVFDEHVSMWHENNGFGISLGEYLGLSDKEFSEMLLESSFFQVAMRKTGSQKLVASSSDEKE